MFRRRGKTRTLQHNLQVASMLSFVAGMVNVVGFLAVTRLTTNVTGHFTYLADAFHKGNYYHAFIFLIYIFCFLLGSFTSGFIIELTLRKNERYVYAVPLLIDIGFLTFVAFLGHKMIAIHPDLVACTLLFAMGLQNSMITQISGAAVRTTHLTGLFTDFGIELSQLFFYKDAVKRKKLISSVKLRLTIISFFFLGGVTGGEVYNYIGIKTLLIAAFALFTGLIYDTVRFRILLLKRKLSLRNSFS